MPTCQTCQVRSQCKVICKDLANEITGRGITASLKPKTYPVDFSHIEDTRNALNSFQRVVLNTLKHLVLEEQWIDRQSLNQLIEKFLPNKIKQVIMLFLEGWSQKEIAKILGISQPSVSLLINEGQEKMKAAFFLNFFCQNSPLPRRE